MNSFEFTRFHMKSNEIAWIHSLKSFDFIWFRMKSFEIWDFSRFHFFCHFLQKLKNSWSLIHFLKIHMNSYNFILYFCQASMKFYDFIRIHSISNDFDRIHMIFGISFLFFIYFTKNYQSPSLFEARLF